MSRTHWLGVLFPIHFGSVTTLRTVHAAAMSVLYGGIWLIASGSLGWKHSPS